MVNRQMMVGLGVNRGPNDQGESNGVVLGLGFLFRTSLSLGEESGRANRFRGSSEVGRTESSSSSPSPSGSPDSSDVSEIRPFPSICGEGDGARLHLLEAMSLVLKKLGSTSLLCQHCCASPSQQP